MKRILLFLPLLAITRVAAQESVKPSPPFVASLPNSIEFVKTYTYPAAKPDQRVEQTDVQKLLSKAPRIQSIDTIKIGNVSEATSTYSDGSSTVSWLWNKYLLQGSSKQPGQATAIPIATLDAYTRRDSTPTLLEVAWIGLNSYTGEQSRGGHRYFAYKKNDETVWIDEETKLPLFFQSLQETIVFTYKEAPTGPLEPPDNFKKQVAASQNSYRGGPP